MRTALLIPFLALVNFTSCRSVRKPKSSESSESVELEKVNLGVSNAEPSFLTELFNPFDQEVPLSTQALKRAKKSLSKRRMKRLSKPKYLEEKFRELVEQRPALKSKIKVKLAERKTKKRVKTAPEFGGDQIVFGGDNNDVYTVPVSNFELVEAPVFVAAPSPSDAPCEVMTTNSNPESLIVLEEQVPFAISNSVEPDCQSRVCGRSIYDEIDKDLIALASNPAFEVHPIEGGEILTQADTAPSAIEIIPSSEPEPVAFFTPESIELEPLSVPFEDESNAKFKKAIPCGQTPEEIFSNCLDLPPTYEFPSEFVMESMPCEDHFYAALEPVKTYEIKQINIDEAAIISELKSVLGEVPGPIIIGEPGEPLIVRHYAKPYVIEYYERPMVVEHHQKAELNVFTSPPVVIDHYEPVVFQEIQAEPLVTVEEVCPYS